MKNRLIFILLLMVFGKNSSFSQIIWANAPTVKVLYKHCANDVMIENLQDCDWQPKVETTQGIVKQNANNPYLFRIIPNQNTCKLTITDQNNKVQYLDYKVIEPPSVNTTLTINGVPYHREYAISKGSKMQIHINLDEIFVQSCEKDASYCINDVSIFAQLEPFKPASKVGGANRVKFGNKNTIDVPIPFMAQQAAGGKIEISFDICRIDYKGELHVMESFRGKNAVILISK